MNNEVHGSGTRHPQLRDDHERTRGGSQHAGGVRAGDHWRAQTSAPATPAVFTRPPARAGRIALAATFMKAETPDGLRWVFQDVHPGGVAARRRHRPGDILLTIDDRSSPPAAMPFALGQTYAVTVRKATERRFATLAVPGSKEKQRPIVVPDQVVTASKARDDLGLIRVSMFPGVLGMDVARDISRADRRSRMFALIVDLRGNTGGGIGCLRVMSHLCAGSARRRVQREPCGWRNTATTRAGCRPSTTSRPRSGA